MIYILGCGAQAEYAYALLYRRLEANKVRVLDPIGKKVGKDFHGRRVERYCLEKLREDSEPQVIIAVADWALKKDLFYDCRYSECCILQVIDENLSYIDYSATIGEGTIINPTVTIEPNAQIGKGCMLHSGAVIQHDVVVGDFCNIRANCVLAGRVKVGEGSVINQGVMVARGIKIGSNVEIGMGSLVLKDIENDVVCYGSPARVVRPNLEEEPT